MTEAASGSADKSVQVKLVLLGEFDQRRLYGLKALLSRALCVIYIS